MSLEQIYDVAMFNRQINYALMALIILHLIADVVVFRMAIMILRKSERLIEMAARHGEESDLRTTRTERKVAELKASSESADLPPPLVPPEARKGCGPALSVLVGAIILVGWMQGSADAAADMRRDGEAKALAWVAAGSPDTPR